MLEKYQASGTIHAIIAENGFINGSNAVAWEKINQEVIDGQFTAHDVFLYGLHVVQPSMFPTGQIEICHALLAAYEKYQDLLCEESGGHHPTIPEVWGKIDELIRAGIFTAHDVFYLGALEHLKKNTNVSDDVDDC